MTFGRRPLLSSLDLVPELSSVPGARRYAAATLRSWHVPPDTADDLVTIASELVSNAIRHAAAVPGTHLPFDGSDTADCTLLQQRWPDSVCVLVRDRTRQPPVLRPPSYETEGGRGLHLVNALSEAWGYVFPEPAPGKAVWASVPLRSGAQQSVRELGHAPPDAHALSTTAP